MTGSQSAIARFRRKILYWGKRNGRDYPWRETDNPFHVLMAELMLRRTRADQVVPVFNDFVATYPDVESLDAADEKDVADAVYSIGLNWRVPSFKSVAKHLVDEHGGEVPSTREELKVMEGVGDYVAGAVLSIAFGKKEWIVDTNVARVFKRYFGLSTIKEARRDPKIVGLAKQYATSSKVREANLALLDLAALVCKAGIPLCSDCPVAEDCCFFNRIRDRPKSS